MRRDLFHFYKGDVKTVYQAYLKVLRAQPFHKEPGQSPYTMLTFGLGFSFKFNMNGGSVHIHFAKRNGGTAVQVRYSIVQLFGARYKAYDKQLTDYVSRALGYEAEPLEVLGDKFFEGGDEVYPDANDDKPAPKAINAPKEEELTCPGCGKKVKAGSAFCPDCGHKIDTPEKKRPAFCVKCGAPLGPDDLFCPKCGEKIEE